VYFLLTFGVHMMFNCALARVLTANLQKERNKPIYNMHFNCDAVITTAKMLGLDTLRSLHIHARIPITHSIIRIVNA